MGMRPLLTNYRAGHVGSKVTAALLVALAMNACDNPAPGEAVEHKPMEETLPTTLPAAAAVQRADIPKSDPGTLDQAEIEKSLPAGPRCGFAYTAESRPVLAATIGREGAVGVFKIHGRLALLAAEQISDFPMLTAGGQFTADGVQLTVTPVPDEAWEEIGNDQHQRPANLRFELTQGLRRDYRGWYRCDRKGDISLD